MKISVAELVALIQVQSIVGEPLPTEITGIAVHSEEVKKGFLFICRNPLYVERAIEQGAVLFLVEEPLLFPIPQVVVLSLKQEEETLFASLYSKQTRDLMLLGVTGTCGKTSTTHLIGHLLGKKNCAVIGTNGFFLGEKRRRLSHTTPDRWSLGELFQQLVDKSIPYAAMEVSSHGLDQGRVAGLSFEVGIFTQLSHDHLDYHKTFARYSEAKSKLFEQVKGVSILNGDDPYAGLMEKKSKAPVMRYGLDPSFDLYAEQIQLRPSGLSFDLKGLSKRVHVGVPLIGLHNVYNLLAALSVALYFGIEDLEERLRQIEPIQGRLERVETGRGFQIYVDYAHKPAALESVLQAIRQMNPKRVITLFGCGGNRDREKRPLMAEIAERYSDYVLVTSDNPRDEPQSLIFKEIELGFKQRRYEVIEDRVEAIQRAIELAKEGDAILIAGKGSEDYQEVGEKRVPFSDALVAKKILLQI